MSNLSNTFEREFPGRLREMRRHKELTQEKLSELLHIDRQTVSAWENGRSTPNTQQLAALCDISGYDSGYFMGEYETKKKFSPEFALRTGLTKKAADEILIMIDQNNHILKTLSILIENSRLMRCIDSATRATYQDGYIERPEKKRQFITAEMMYNAERTAVFAELMDFIDEVRKKTGLDPL